MSNPTYVIYPNDISDKKDREEAYDLSRYLRQHYLDWTDTNAIHQYVHKATIFPEAYWVFSVEKTWDIEKQVYITDIRPIIEDPFDWLYDARYEMQDNAMLIRILRKSDYSIRNTYNNFKSSGFVTDFKEFFFGVDFL